MESKAYRLGTHRTRTPIDTLKQVQPLLKQMGITRVANVTGLDRVGIPVYTAFRPHSRSVSVSQGKGSSLDAARVSAVMESAEAYHAEHITLPLRFGSIDALKDELALIEIDGLARNNHKRLATNQPIFWIEGRNLFDDQPYWLPFEIVSTDYTLPNHAGAGYFSANTNGLASGNTFKEASCHAITEVIERDAEALWNQQAVRLQSATGVSASSVNDENCQWLLNQFEQANIDIKIWDMTSDVQIPCYICLAMGDQHDWADPEFGAGCHTSRQVALARALSEAAQARATFIAGSRDDIGPSEYAQKRRMERAIQAKKLIRAHTSSRRFDRAITYDFEHIEDDLEVCLARLKAVGISQVVAVDLSKSTLGLSVVKVVIPGLEGAYGHGHSSYRPGTRAKTIANLPFDIGQ